ncbi:type VI secretion system baseplate subunit TssF [Gemmata sp.]|uniref:type VI secretion system baseplate subunit TssF n=1 Tax=Gemmata sp. TaxID=1914242 RepID=UPI003F6F6E77
MSRSLYPYYEKELYFLRQAAQEFARQYPATAGRLLLEPNRSVDPHVERLLEGFALLAGRVQHKLDDEFPQLTTALLGVMYPHYLAPVPSFAVVQFEPDPAGLTSPTGFTLPVGTRLRTPPVSGVPCRYRTAYPVDLWPVVVSAADWVTPPFPRDFRPPPGTAAVLRLGLEIPSGLRFADLKLDRLRLFLNGDAQLVADLYEALLNKPVGVAFRDPAAAKDPAGDNRVTLAAKDCIFPVGFGPDEGLVPAPPQALPAYRLLTEYFAFPDKFNFIDLGGFERARAVAGGRRVEVLVFARRTRPLLEQGVEAGTFRTGCAPAVNLFEQTAEPINLTHARTEYRVVPDVAAPLGTEVYSVEAVRATLPGGADTEFRPFFGIRYGAGPGRAFWHATRRPAESADDKGTESYLELVDLDFRPASPGDGVVVVRTTCTNRDLPLILRQAGGRVAFSAEVAGPIARVRCLSGPTAPSRPPPARGAYWRLISHLNLNHLTLDGGDAGADALRTLLGLYDHGATDPARRGAGNQVIDGVTHVAARPVVRRVGKLSSGGFCRGLAIDLELDEEKFVGAGAYLFASVLERFFALHAALNSFTELTARLRGADGAFAQWPPRAGEQPLL